MALLALAGGAVSAGAESHGAAQASGTIQPSALRCDWRENPLGVQTASPVLSWIPSAAHLGLRGLHQTAYRVIVASSLASLARERGNVWDSGKVDAADVVRVRYAGPALRSHAVYWWKVQLWDAQGRPSRWSDAATFTMGLLHAQDWTAHWITAGADVLGADPQHSAVALPVFRHAFRLRGRVTRALLFVSGLGQYEVSLNGWPVTPSVLNPGWTDYRKTVLYNSYDVTGAVRSGENAIGVLMGNGMYNVPETPGRYLKLTGSFGPPKLILQMQVSYADGREETVASDGSWKAAKSPVVFSSTYGGEDYDARIDAGWDRVGFADSTWANATVTDGPGGTLEAQRIPPISEMRTFHPVKMTKPKPGITVYDLGQNFSGWPRIAVEGPAGSSVKLIPGELLDDEGRVSQRTFHGPVWFTYTLDGKGIERWHPRFTYSGFRYVQVETAPAEGSQEKPRVVELTGAFVHSSARVTGTFSADNELFSKIHTLIDRAIESNMQSVLTDCPHREKLGWLEQTHLMGDGLFYGFNVHTLYEKMAGDMADSQLPNGLVPEIAPEYTVFSDGFRDSPEWGSAVILSPWTDYRFTGDVNLLADHYIQMQRYVDYLGSKATNHILSHGLGDWYDMGPKPPGYAQLTGMKVTATAVYFQDLTVLTKIAGLLGHADDAARYTALAEEVKASYNRELFHPTSNTYDTGSQTADAISLAVGLVPDDRRQAVMDSLVADVRAHNNHLTAGDVGFHYVIEALLAGGRSDVINDIVSRTDPPSYGYQLRMGATSLTEAWNANPTSSQNHFMLGHAEEWFYRGLAGLDFDLSRPAGEQIILRPQMVSGTGSASAAYDSAVGRISVAWKKTQGRAEIDATIPVGRSALVYVPGASPDGITESGRPAKEVTGVAWVRSEAGEQVFRVESGEYHFATGQ
ncbi:MAG: family 78 glycoside hydrolase catalytic domain [Acidobacteriota bacterium]|nr:family 78 glycoside hydrolase catalytic domain [Acidobacteriota bacterium]